MKVATLAEVTDLITDGTHGSPTRTDSGVPVLGAQNVKNGRLSMQTTRFTSDAELAAFERRVTPQRGDVLLTIVGTIGRAAVLSEPPGAVFQRSVAVIRPDISRLDGRFLLHLTQSRDFQEQMRRSTNQSSQAGIYLGKLKALTLLLPTLAEQRRIAAILDQADALRAKRRQALAHLDDLTHSVFFDMFGDPTKGDRWPLATVSEIAADQKHAIVDGPFGSALKPTDYVESGVPVIRIKNISRAGELQRSGLLFISPEKFGTLLRSSLQPGDVLVSRVGTLGNTCIFPSDIGDALLSTTGVCKITPNANRILSGFLHAAFRTHSFQRQIERSASTSVQKYFNLSALRAWKVITPPIDLQTEFVERLRALSTHRDLLRQHAVGEELMFASLQSRAFAGTI